jgi:5-formyltetrahydrofolate cyclo-ligase
MKAHELKRAKREVRRSVLTLRDAMSPEERGRLGALAVRRFLSLVEVDRAGTVSAFWSFGSEVPTDPLLSGLLERGIRVALPRVVGDTLELRSWAAGDPVTTTTFGAREPAGGERVDPSEVDVVCTPAVAFDRRGHRVGYGGGFYDRLFSSTRADALRAGIAFDVQVVEGDLPQGRFDQPVDVVVTPTRMLRREGER